MLNQMQHSIDLEYDKMAGALIDRLSDAGIVMVPRLANAIMQGEGMLALEECRLRNGGATSNSEPQACWDAMIKEGEAVVGRLTDHEPTALSSNGDVEHL